MDLFIGTFMFITSVYILYLAIKSSSMQCQKTIEYRYIPRTFEEEQKEPVKASLVFKRMFEDPTPRNGSFSKI